MPGNLSSRLGEATARPGFDLLASDSDDDDFVVVEARKKDGAPLDIADATERAIFADAQREAIARVRGEETIATRAPVRNTHGARARPTQRQPAARAGAALDASNLEALLSTAPARAGLETEAGAALDASSLDSFMASHRRRALDTGNESVGVRTDPSRLNLGNLIDSGVVGGSMTTVEALEQLSKVLPVVSREIVPVSNVVGSVGGTATPAPCCGGRPPVGIVWLIDHAEDATSVADMLAMQLNARVTGVGGEFSGLPPIYLGVVQPPRNFFRQLGRDASAWMDPGCPLVSSGDPCSAGVSVDHLTVLAEIQNAVSRVQRVVESIADGGVWTERTILCGSGQGGTLAVHAAATQEYKDTPLAGAVSFGGGCALASALTSEKITRAGRSRPVLLARGEGDDAMPTAHVDVAVTMLARVGIPVRSQTLPGGGRGLGGYMIDALLRCVTKWCDTPVSSQRPKGAAAFTEAQELLDEAGVPQPSPMVLGATVSR